MPSLISQKVKGVFQSRPWPGIATAGWKDCPAEPLRRTANDINTCQRAGEAITGKAFDDFSLSRVTGGVL